MKLFFNRVEIRFKKIDSTLLFHSYTNRICEQIIILFLRIRLYSIDAITPTGAW